MIELNEQQRQAIHQTPSEPVRLVDPETNETYVLVKVEVFERMRGLLGDDDDVRGGMYLVNEAMAEDDRDDPLLESYQKYRKGQG